RRSARPRDVSPGCGRATGQHQRRAASERTGRGQTQGSKTLRGGTPAIASRATATVDRGRRKRGCGRVFDATRKRGARFAERIPGPRGTVRRARQGGGRQVGPV